MGVADRNRGIEAYQRKDFEEAIEFLEGSDEWDAHLYLGMSYYMAGRHEEARKEFMHLKEKCPDQDIRTKAASAFVAVNAKLVGAETKARREEDEEVEW